MARLVIDKDGVRQPRKVLTDREMAEKMIRKPGQPVNVGRVEKMEDDT